MENNLTKSSTSSISRRSSGSTTKGSTSSIPRRTSSSTTKGSTSSISRRSSGSTTKGSTSSASRRTSSSTTKGSTSSASRRTSSSITKSSTINVTNGVSNNKSKVVNASRVIKRKRRLRLKKGPKIILVLIILSLFSCIYLYTHSKKYLFIKALDKVYCDFMANINTFVDNYMPYTYSDYHNNINSVVKVNTSKLDSTIKFNGDIYLTSTSNYFDINIDTNGSDYGLELLSKENKLYFKIDDSNFYYDNLNNVNFSNKNYFRLFEIFMSNFKDNIKSGNLEKNNEKIVVDSKSYNTKKISINFDDELYINVMQDFYLDIKNDIELLDVLLSLTGFVSREELVAYFENDNIALKDIIGDNVEFSIYLYKNKPIKVEISYGKNESLLFLSCEGYFEIDLVFDGVVSYLKIHDKKIDLFLDGIGYGNGSYDENSFKMDFVDYHGDLIGNISYSIDKNNNKYSNKVIFNLDLSDIDISIDSSNSIEINKNIPNININNSIIANDMHGSDKEILSELLSAINLIFAF